MRKLKKMTMVAVCVISLMMSVLMMTGCTGGSSESEKSVSLVLGVHNYFPKVTLNSESIYTKIYEACYSYGNCSAVIVDGEPFVACNYNIDNPKKNIDTAKKEQLAKQNTEQILSNVSSLSAQTPEIDTLSAISLSANTLHSASNECEKSMIVFDSGLSTTSLLNFAEQNIIDAPVESIVEQLKELHAIPDLSDIEITWIGIGVTCGKQNRLTDNYKYKLQELWNAILEAGEAKKVCFDTTPVSNEENDNNLPKCTTVPIIADPLEVEQIESEETIPEIMKWDENSSIKFEADQAKFVNEKAVGKELKPIAAYLKNNSEEKIYIFGMTATVLGGDSGIELSKERAEVCKEVLIKQGVKEEQLICVGLGKIDNPLRVKNDIDENGKQIESLAKKNRAVFFIRENSKLVNELMKYIKKVM